VPVDCGCMRASLPALTALLREPYPAGLRIAGRAALPNEGTHAMHHDLMERMAAASALLDLPVHDGIRRDNAAPRSVAGRAR
jgi:hypothetical protein